MGFLGAPRCRASAGEPEQAPCRGLAGVVGAGLGSGMPGQGAPGRRCQFACLGLPSLPLGLDDPQRSLPTPTILGFAAGRVAECATWPCRSPRALRAAERAGSGGSAWAGPLAAGLATRRPSRLTGAQRRCQGSAPRGCCSGSW